MKRYRLRKWVKVVIGILIAFIVGVAIYQTFTVKTTMNTPTGDYTCKGGLIKVCSGSREVAQYLGN
jgi:hypothetical protein